MFTERTKCVEENWETGYTGEMGLLAEDFDKCTQCMGSLETLPAEMGSKCILMANLQRRMKSTVFF